MSRSLLFCAVFFLLSIVSYSQEPPIEWGEIPKEDLLMKTFPGDSNATAVVLCDYGVTKMDNDLNLKYERLLRIKILNEKGYKWGTHSISLYTEDNYEDLDDLEAVTYSLDEDGEIVENELDDDNIFEEEVTDERTRYKFTMPALSPGCIIEIRYSIIASSWYFIRDWTFQWEEPVRWSEYRVVMPRTIAYAFVSMGYEPWDIKENTEVTQAFMGNAAASLGGNLVKCNQYRWVVKNIKALRDVPYITTLSDYQNRVEAQLAGYAYRGVGMKRVLQDWNALVKELMDNSSFYDRIEETGDVQDLTTEITKGMTTPKEKLEAIYKWITGSIVWTGEQRVFSENDADDVIEYKKGNSADIAFLLLSMLKSAGIEGDPVILSTRGNGKIQDLYPIVSQFNLTIARVKIGSDIYYIDATDELRPLDELPKKILNVRGLVIKSGKPEWVTISAKDADDVKAVVNMNIADDGSLSSDIEVVYGKYSSLSIRRDLEDESETDLAKDLFDTEESGFTIDSIQVSDKDDINLPVKIKAWLSSPEYIQSAGDMMYLNPVIFHRLKDNPFKAGKRQFPVDYSYPSSETVVTNIRIPSSMELKEEYPSRSFRVSSNISYKRNSKSSDQEMQIISKFDIKKSVVSSRDYSRLKDFYSRLVSTEADMVVLGTRAAAGEPNTVGMQSESEK